MKYNCPICGYEMSESNFCNIYHCSRCVMSTEVKVLDAIATKDARVAGLEKEIAALRTCIIDCGSELSRLEKERDEAYNAGMRAVLDKQR